FSFLVKWQRSNGVKLSGDDLESLFEAALANPGWNSTGRASIEAAYREYYEFVVRDLELALPHAKAATDAWPEQWSYHVKLADILRRLGRTDEALAALEKAQKTASNADQTQQTATAIAELMRDSRN
ncbi:MAG: tetratricopeptide repeat protein, partial [Gammaproteobacteria bacterium]|nr:tetratricopeptide repeat protein [Gammaproteobacteria bacterium]